MSDDLFMLPTGTDLHAGGAEADNVVSVFASEALKKEMNSDKKFDVQDVPILLVSNGVGASKKTSMFKDSGLSTSLIVGINGPAVQHILNNYKKIDKELLKHIVLNTDNLSYTSTDDLLGEQVCFIILFNHLLFLASLNDASFSATFQDNLEERFNVLGAAIEKSKSKTNVKNDAKAGDKRAGDKIFGEKRSTVTAFWDTLQKKYIKNEKNRRTYADIEGFIIAGADRVLQYLIKSQVEIQAGVPNNNTEAGFEGLETGFEAKEPEDDIKNNVSNTASTAETHGEDEEEPKIAGPIVTNKAAASAPAASITGTDDPKEASTTSTQRKPTVSANKAISQQPIGKVNVTRRGTSIRPPHPTPPSVPSIEESNKENNNNGNNENNEKSVRSVAVNKRRSRKLYRRRK
jgi:hypothetical protein